MDQEGNKKYNKDRHIQWDEEKLKETEKYRGTFQKITEPKTPYRGNSDQQMEEADTGEKKTEEQLEVDESLKQAKKNRQNNRHNKIDLAALNAQLKVQITKYKQQTGEPMSQEQVQTEEQIKKKEEFKKKRAAHYNEFQMIQQAKNKSWDTDSDND